MSRKRPAGTSRRASAPRGERRAAPAASASPALPRLAAWCAPALLALLLFLPSLPYAFVWDDHGLIENNLLLRGTGGLLTLLRSDPHDEPTHLQLVQTLLRVGRHGEARRSYRTYAARMAEIDVEPAPYPQRDRHLAG